VRQLLLALDTTNEFGSLALLAGELVLEEALVHGKDGFGHILFGEIAALLERHNAAIEQVVCFAAASGPGTFTGVRVGLACIQGLAEGAGTPAAAVSNLEALACFGRGPLRAAAIDARRGEIYAGLFDGEGRAITPESVQKPGIWLANLPEGEIEFITQTPEMLRPALAGTRHERARITSAPAGLASRIGRIAWRRYLAGETQDPAAIDANYVRRTDAELALKRP
jgi:tRNA threonylcarbamoyladenosine biosynthesis protein TsaB